MGGAGWRRAAGPGGGGRCTAGRGARSASARPRQDMEPDGPLPLHARVRWGNVARAGALAALAGIVLAWPHLRAREPALPPAEAVPVVPAVPAAPPPPDPGAASGSGPGAVPAPRSAPIPAAASAPRASAPRARHRAPTHVVRRAMARGKHSPHHRPPRVLQSPSAIPPRAERPRIPRPTTPPPTAPPRAAVPSARETTAPGFAAPGASGPSGTGVRVGVRLEGWSRPGISVGWQRGANVFACDSSAPASAVADIDRRDGRGVGEQHR